MRMLLSAVALSMAMAQANAASPAIDRQAAASRGTVELEMMTWPEIKAALAEGKTTALIYTGGTEQMGPQNVVGGHSLVGKPTAVAIAKELGNALVLPTLPYTPNAANPAQPGTLGLTTDLLGLVLERIAEQAILNGFKTVVLMGDHGGGQPTVYEKVANELTQKYAAKGSRVLYCSDVYKAAADAFDEYLDSKGYPPSSHGGLTITSLMLYLTDGSWVRENLVASALGDPVPAPGQRLDPSMLRVNNGIIGDGRRSSAELGKIEFDMRVDYAVKQIRSLMGDAKGSTN